MDIIKKKKFFFFFSPLTRTNSRSQLQYPNLKLTAVNRAVAASLASQAMARPVFIRQKLEPMSSSDIACSSLSIVSGLVLVCIQWYLV